MDINDINDHVIHCYPDADLAGTFDTTKATSGGFVEVTGPNSFFPLDWYSQRQTNTAHSTTDAELVSLSKMLRESLVPIQSLWSTLLQRPVKAILHEDNTATITVVNAGCSPQLRYMAKHHRISLGLVHELISSHDDIELVHVETNLQKGDLMTKGLQRPKHDPAMDMVGLYPVIVL